MEEKKQTIEAVAVQKRSFEGAVVKISGAKTISVKVNSVKMHPKYHKQYTISRKFAVHDEKLIAKVGDIVRFVECRPISKAKRWTLKEVIKTA